MEEEGHVFDLADLERMLEADGDMSDEYYRLLDKNPRTYKE